MDAERRTASEPSPERPSLVERLREAATVLDEPFHHNAIAVDLLEAADALASALQRAEQAEQHRDDLQLCLDHALATIDSLETTLEVERQTSMNDPAEQRAERYALEVADLSRRLEQAEQERDEARKIVAQVNNSVIGSYGYFTEPNVVEEIEKGKVLTNRAINDLQAKLTEAEATIKVYEKELQTTLDLYERKLRVMRAALEPFAAKVHHDGVDAPYPEEHWIPLLDAAKAALKS